MFTFSSWEKNVVVFINWDNNWVSYSLILHRAFYRAGVTEIVTLFKVTAKELIGSSLIRPSGSYRRTRLEESAPLVARKPNAFLLIIYLQWRENRHVAYAVTLLTT